MKKVFKLISYPFLYFYYSFVYSLINKFQFQFLSDSDLIKKIILDNKSICRFGDGEFKWIMNVHQNSFQKQSNILKEALYNVLNDYKDNKNIIICINKPIVDLSPFTLKAKGYWKKFMVKYHNKLKKIIPKDYTYGDANITRPYMDYKNKDRKCISSKFRLVKRIWDNRDIIIVEGKDTKLGIGNDLFDNCKSIHRIICPSTNAFEKYDDIYNAIIDNGKDKLYLLSLGPTATILSYELSSVGFQCIDSGHIDIEYMWFLNNDRFKNNVTGKYVNESGKNMINNSDAEDEDYLNSIIARIEG